jgi:hypothetical protein
MGLPPGVSRQEEEEDDSGHDQGDDGGREIAQRRHQAVSSSSGSSRYGNPDASKSKPIAMSSQASAAKSTRPFTHTRAAPAATSAADRLKK